MEQLTPFKVPVLIFSTLSTLNHRVYRKNKIATPQRT